MVRETFHKVGRAHFAVNCKFGSSSEQGAENMIPPQKFGFCTFTQVTEFIFSVTDKNGSTVYYGDNPIAAMVAVMGVFETTIRKKLLPLILQEGYNRIGKRIYTRKEDKNDRL